MIKNVILDMGNVLLDYDPEVPLKAFCSSKEERDVIRRELFNGPEWVQGDQGVIQREEMYGLIESRVPEPFRKALKRCAEQWDICMKPTEGAKEFCEKVKKQGYRIFVLSNASNQFYHYFERLLPLSFFDGIVISSEVRILKPDKGIYEYLLKRYQLNPTECFFLDDRIDNVNGAIAVGMNALQFKNDFHVVWEVLDAELSVRNQKEYEELKQWLLKTKEEPLEAMGGFFNRRVDSYEEHMAQWKKHYQWLAKLLPEKTETLIDLGCGTGLELDEIFQKFPELNVTGIDLAEEMLAKLQKKHNGRKLTLINGDYFQVDYGDECFDAVVAMETLHHFTAEKKTEVFRKISKSLKNGGVYLECDYIASSQEIEDMTFQERERRCRRDGISKEKFIHFDTPLTLSHELEAIQKGGFSKVEFLGLLPGDNHTAMIRAIK